MFSNDSRLVFLIGIMLLASACHTASDPASATNAATQKDELSFGVDDPSTNDLAYLTQLGLMRGHLYVGHELYKAGHIEHAKTHMKHPKSELYMGISNAFDVRGAKGFAVQLGRLSEAVESEATLAHVGSLYLALLGEIGTNELLVDQPSLEPAERFRLVARLLGIAAEEYAIAVVNGETQNAHEYQDALGFTIVASSVVESIDSDNPAVVYAKQASQQQLASLKAHWPTLIPPDSLSTRASAISASAEAILKLASGLE